MELFRPQTNQLVLKGPVTRDGHQHVDEGRHVCQLSVQSSISIGKNSQQTKQNLVLDQTTKIKVIFSRFSVERRQAESEGGSPDTRDAGKKQHLLCRLSDNTLHLLSVLNLTRTFPLNLSPKYFSR